MATARSLRGEAGKKIASIGNYFAAHAHRLRYDECLGTGYPIATGTTSMPHAGSRNVKPSIPTDNS